MLNLTLASKYRLAKTGILLVLGLMMYFTSQLKQENNLLPSQTSLSFPLVDNSGVALSIASDSEILELVSYISVYEDVSANLTFQDLYSERQNFQFERIPQRTLNFAMSESAFWLHMQVDNLTAKTIERIMRLDAYFIESISIYHMEAGELKQTMASGDMMAPVSRPLFDRRYAWPLEFSAESTSDVYIRVFTRFPYQVPLYLFTEESLRKYESETQLFLGVCFGFILVVMVYNLVIYSVTRNRVFLFYAAVGISLLFFMSIIKGFAHTYFWPYEVGTHYKLVIFSSLFASSAVYLFLRELLDFPANVKGVDQFCQVCFVILVLSALVYLIWEAGFVIYFAVIMVCCLDVCILFALIMMAFRNDSFALQVLYGWVVLLGAVFIHVGREMGALISNFYSVHALLGGAVLQTVFLSIVIALKIQREKTELLHLEHTNLELARRVADQMQDRYNAEKELREMEEKSKAHLENQVNLRTQELNDTLQRLESVNTQLMNLNRQDALTETFNRRHYEEHISRELLIAKEQQGQVGLLVIDVDFFKRFNDTHGHQAGDVCLRKLTGFFQSQLRGKSDVLCRFGGEEFVVVLSNSNEAEALLVAEKLRLFVESQTIPIGRERVSVTVSIGISAYDENNNVDSIELFKQADTALYEAKALGRNCSLTFTQYRAMGSSTGAHCD